MGRMLPLPKAELRLPLAVKGPVSPEPSNRGKSCERSRSFPWGAEGRGGHSLLWPRRSCQEGEVHGDAVSPGWLAAVLCGAVGDIGGVPPEPLVPLHTEGGGVKGKGRQVRQSRAARTRVPKGKGAGAGRSPG